MKLQTAFQCLPHRRESAKVAFAPRLISVKKVEIAKANERRMESLSKISDMLKRGKLDRHTPARDKVNASDDSTAAVITPKRQRNDAALLNDFLPSLSEIAEKSVAADNSGAALTAVVAA